MPPERVRLDTKVPPGVKAQMQALAVLRGTTLAVEIEAAMRDHLTRHVAELRLVGADSDADTVTQAAPS